MKEQEQSGAKQSGPEQAGLEELRAGIRAIDAELVRLLNQRAAYSLAVGEVKRARSAGSGEEKDAEGAVFRPGREAQILRHLEALCDGPLPKAHLQAIYREILSSSRNLQRPQRVAFLGPEASLSHIAGKKLLGTLAGFQPQASLEEVFQAVCDQDCDIGIVPLAQCPDLFMRYPGIYILADTPARFAVIGRSPADAPGPDSKSTIIFSLPDERDEAGKAGALDAVLALLTATGLQLLDPTPKPLPAESGELLYVLYIAGNIMAAEHAHSLERVREKCRSFRLLGCYPTLG